MWKQFIPPSFRITREQQSRIENFIDIGDAFIQNLAKFSRQGKYFKNNLDWLLSKQRERAQHKRENERLEKIQAFEKKREKEKHKKLQVLENDREQEEI